MDNNFEWLRRKYAQSVAKLERWEQYHGDAVIHHREPNRIICSILDEIIYELPEDGDGIPIGSENFDDQKAARIESCIERFRSNFREEILTASLELTGILLDISRKTVEETVVWQERGRTLKESAEEKQGDLFEYYSNYLSGCPAEPEEIFIFLGSDEEELICDDCQFLIFNGGRPLRLANTAGPSDFADDNDKGLPYNTAIVLIPGTKEAIQWASEEIKKNQKE